MIESINSLTDAIWSAIQRPSPAITRDEIAAILRDALDAPTASEEIRVAADYQWSDEELEVLRTTYPGSALVPNRIQSNMAERHRTLSVNDIRELADRAKAGRMKPIRLPDGKEYYLYGNGPITDDTIVATIPAGTPITRALIDDIKSKVIEQMTNASQD